MNASHGGLAKLLLNMPPDAEITGRLFWQAREPLGPELKVFLREQIQREKFVNILLDTMIKCHAMQHHISNFVALEQRFIAHVESGGHALESGHELLFELEAFLFQVKSSLDIGIKMLSVLLPGRFATATFTDKGARLISGLEQFDRDKYAKHELVSHLIGMLHDDREAWLEQAITLRDTMSHFKTFAEFQYRSVSIEGKAKCASPRIAGLGPTDYINCTYRNCIEFLQDFMCLTIGLFLPPNFSVGLRSGSTCSVGEPLAQYIKFGLALPPEIEPG